MIKLAELIGTLSTYHEAQRQLEQCRQHATGDVEYFSYSYIQDLKLAEKDLEEALNGYIDQRIAEMVQRPNAPLSRPDPLSAAS